MVIKLRETGIEGNLYTLSCSKHIRSKIFLLDLFKDLKSSYISIFRVHFYCTSFKLFFDLFFKVELFISTSGGYKLIVPRHFGQI